MLPWVLNGRVQKILPQRVSRTRRLEDEVGVFLEEALEAYWGQSTSTGRLQNKHCQFRTPFSLVELRFQYHWLYNACQIDCIVIIYVA